MFKDFIKSASKLLDGISKYSKKHSPEILAGCGIAGFITTTILAVKATPIAYMKLEDAVGEKVIKAYSNNNTDPIDPNNQKLTLTEKVQTVWKDYLPAAITGAASTVCVISSVSIACRRSAVLAAACTLAEESMKEYKNKVVEVIGEKKEKHIREEIAQDKIKDNPPSSNQVIITNQGNSLIYETVSGRYFKFNIDKIHKIEGKVNKEITNENYISLNKLFSYFDLDSIDMGDELGWSSEDGYLEFEYNSKLTEDDEPCLILSYSRNPKAGYSMFYGRY